MIVRWHAAGWDEVPPGGAWLAGPERARAARLRVPKRRDELLLTRWTVKRALAQVLGLGGDVASLARLEVRNAADGAPEVFLDGSPVPYGLSLTDRAGFAVCVLGPPGRALGCDLELIEPRSEAFVGDFLTPSEQALVRAAPDAEGRALRANLVWSAKESALKVLRTGLRRDTRSVEVRLVPGDAAGRWQPLVVVAVEGTRFPGWWRRDGALLVTVAGAGALSCPVALTEPHALVDAAPRAGW